MPDRISSRLIAARKAAGATTTRGQLLSCLIEQLENLRTYRRPAWAGHKVQTLPHMIARTLALLERP